MLCSQVVGIAADGSLTVVEEFFHHDAYTIWRFSQMGSFPSRRALQQHDCSIMGVFGDITNHICICGWTLNLSVYVLVLFLSCFFFVAMFPIRSSTPAWSSSATLLPANVSDETKFSHLGISPFFFPSFCL